MFVSSQENHIVLVVVVSGAMMIEQNDLGRDSISHNWSPKWWNGVAGDVVAKMMNFVAAAMWQIVINLAAFELNPE